MSDNLLASYREAIVNIFDNHEITIILYGSYARGDFNQDSDIDIMILAEVQSEEVSYYADKVYDLAVLLKMNHLCSIGDSNQIDYNSILLKAV